MKHTNWTTSDGATIFIAYFKGEAVNLTLDDGDTNLTVEDLDKLVNRLMEYRGYLTQPQPERE